MEWYLYIFKFEKKPIKYKWNNHEIEHVKQLGVSICIFASQVFDLLTLTYR